MEMEFQRGLRDKISNHMDISEPIEVVMQIAGDCKFNFCCFGVDSNEKITDLNYILFSGHKRSPNGEITYSCENNRAVFTIFPEKLPQSVYKVVFSLNIEGNGMMNGIDCFYVGIGNSGKEALSTDFTARDFRSEKALEVVSIYRKEEWRFSVPATGFNRGLEYLLKHYGGTMEMFDEIAEASQNEIENVPEIEEVPSVPTIDEADFEKEETPVPTIDEADFEKEEPPVPTIDEADFEKEETPVPLIDEAAFEDKREIPPVQTISADAFEETPVISKFEGDTSEDTPFGSFFDTESVSELPPVQTIELEEDDAESLSIPEQTAEIQPAEQTDSAEWIFDADDAEPEKKTVDEDADVKRIPPKPQPITNGKPMNVQDFAAISAPIRAKLEGKNLENCVARVALVMDMTGSMRRTYASGVTQDVINKILPLALQFDDDGQLDFWFYANDYVRRPSIGLENYQFAVSQNWEDIMNSLGIVNNEPAVMEDVIRNFVQTELPVYVIFVTDGGAVYSRRIAELLRESSNQPIFWQFVGINGSDYNVFENLDLITDRFVNNAAFFAFDDFRRVPDDFLYERLLSEFSVWYKEIQKLGMI